MRQTESSPMWNNAPSSSRKIKKYGEGTHIFKDGFKIIVLLLDFEQGSMTFKLLKWVFLGTGCHKEFLRGVKRRILFILHVLLLRCEGPVQNFIRIDFVVANVPLSCNETLTTNWLTGEDLFYFWIWIPRIFFCQFF